MNLMHSIIIQDTHVKGNNSVENIVISSRSRGSPLLREQVQSHPFAPALWRNKKSPQAEQACTLLVAVETGMIFPTGSGVGNDKKGRLLTSMLEGP